MQPCHHESQPAPSSTPTHSVLLVRASQLSQTTPSSPWIYFGFHNHAIWKNTYRTQEDCEASLNCFLDYLREPAADGGRKIHDLTWANAYAKCNGVWPRTVSHTVSFASYPYGDDSASASMWPRDPHALDGASQSCDFPCRVNTQTPLEYGASPFTIRPPRVALLQPLRVGLQAVRLGQSNSRRSGRWGAHHNLHSRRRLWSSRAHCASLQGQEEPPSVRPAAEAPSGCSGVDRRDHRVAVVIFYRDGAAKANDDLVLDRVAATRR